MMKKTDLKVWGMDFYTDDTLGPSDVYVFPDFEKLRVEHPNATFEELVNAYLASAVNVSAGTAET